MTKHGFIVLGVALAIGFAALLGATNGRSAEAASNPVVTTSDGIAADTCTSTQTGYYGGVYGSGFYGNAYGVYDAWNYPPQVVAPGVPTYTVPGYGYMIPAAVPGVVPGYGQVFAATNCNYTQCQPVPFYTIAVVCPGPAAGITVPTSPTTSTCASAENITVTVQDAAGLKVADGTEVDFSTTFGMITAVTWTNDGQATASLNTPTKQTGTAVISIKSGAASAGMTISVSCGTAGAPVQASVAPPAPSSGGGVYGY